MCNSGLDCWNSGPLEVVYESFLGRDAIHRFYVDWPAVCDNSTIGPCEAAGNGRRNREDRLAARTRQNLLLRLHHPRCREHVLPQAGPPRRPQHWQLERRGCIPPGFGPYIHIRPAFLDVFRGAAAPARPRIQVLTPIRGDEPPQHCCLRNSGPTILDPLMPDC